MIKQVQTIAPKLQADALCAFWQMLRSVERQAVAEKDAVLHVQVEGYYLLWNDMTGDNKEPEWVTRDKQARTDWLKYLSIVPS